MTLDNLNTQKIELHTNSEDISEIKLTSMLPSAQNSHLINWTLLALNIFLFDPNSCLAPCQNLSYRELNVVAPISSLAMHKILVSFNTACNTADSNFEIYFQSRLWTQNRWSVGFLYSWTKSHHIFAPLK